MNTKAVFKCAAPAMLVAASALLLTGCSMANNKITTVGSAPVGTQSTPTTAVATPAAQPGDSGAAVETEASPSFPRTSDTAGSCGGAVFQVDSIGLDPVDGLSRIVAQREACISGPGAPDDVVYDPIGPELGFDVMPTAPVVFAHYPQPGPKNETWAQFAARGGFPGNDARPDDVELWFDRNGHVDQVQVSWHP